MATQTEVTPQQAYTNRVYHELIGQHGIRLNKKQYSYQLGKFRAILETDNATHSEAVAAGDRIVERLPHYSKMDAVQALQDIRRAAAIAEPEPEPEPAPAREPESADPTLIDYPLLQRAAHRMCEGLTDADIEDRVRDNLMAREWADMELQRRRDESEAAHA